MRILSALLGMATAMSLSAPVLAACGPEALGTSRILSVDTSNYREILGDEPSFGLKDKEVILTFDDGPISGKTSRILDTLERECVKATFFYVGRMARAYPSLVRRVVAEGHTLAHHTDAHNRLPGHSNQSASRVIDKGIRTLQKIAYGEATSKPKVPFFRYPYLARNKRTDKVLAAKGLIAFGANIDSLDWKRNSPSTVLNRIMRILKREGKGIILMHDIQNRTAKMLPSLLRRLKSEGYKVVHMVPKGHGLEKQPKQDGELLLSKVETGQDKGKSTQADVSKVTLQEKVTPVAYQTHGDAEIEELTRQAQQELNKTLERSGVKVSTKLPANIAQTRIQQLKVLKSEPTSKVTQSVAVIPAPTKVVSRRLKRSSKRPQANVSIGGSNWKLRRSQWILN